MGYGKITAKQQEILDYIKDEILKRGYPPTVREICETVNLKVYLFRSFSSGDIGEERLYPQRPHQAPCH